MSTYLYGQSFFKITAEEHAALEAALNNITDPDLKAALEASGLLHDCSYVSNQYQGYFFVKIKDLDEFEQDWLLDNDLFFDQTEFLLSQFYSVY